MSHLFVYGTLMHPAILRAVCGLTRKGEEATLEGYRRQPVQGEAYPAVAAVDGTAVRGMIYHHVPVMAWRRLDSYEGPFYRRQTVSVTLADGRRETVQSYLLRRRFIDRLEEGEWDYERFVTHHLTAYLRMLRQD